VTAQPSRASRASNRRPRTESTFDYLQATRGYLEAHGKPVAFYRWDAFPHNPHKFTVKPVLAMRKGGLGSLGMSNDLLRAGGGLHPLLQSLGVRRGQLSCGSGQAPPGTALSRTSLTHLGFGLPPHYRLAAGGASPGDGPSRRSRRRR
jgi:hypothetical protein